MVHILSGRAETPTQSKILTSVRDEGPLSRIDLAGRLGVSRTTVAAEAGRLVELGLAVDGGPAESRGGRRSQLVDLDPRLRFVGIELGATSMRVAVTDGRLQVLARDHKPLDIRRGPETVLADALDSTRKLLATEGIERPAGVGIGVPGPVDFQGGVPVSPPIMPGWDGYPVRDALSRELGCPVLLDNDVNVMALGEQHTGVARSASDFLFVKIGTGIGCGIVVGGHLYRGADGCAGDIGHIRLEADGRSARAATRAASRPSSAAPPSPATRARRRPVGPVRGARRAARGRTACSRPRASGRPGSRRRHRPPADPRRRAPRRHRARQPGLASSTPG